MSQSPSLVASAIRSALCDRARRRGSSTRSFRALKLGDLCTRRVDQFRVGVGVPSKPPPAFNCLGEEHPGPRTKRRIAGGSCDQVGELADHGELLVTEAIEGGWGLAGHANT